MSLAVGTRYARALADIAFKEDSVIDPDRLAEELRVFLTEFDASVELQKVLATPAILNSKKRAVVSLLADKLGLSQTTRHFLFVLIERRRQNLLRIILNAYIHLMDERRGVVEAKISSAVELSAEERAAIEERVAATSGKKVRSEYHIDPNLLGGVVVRVGSQVFDGSVRGRLQALGTQLAAGV